MFWRIRLLRFLGLHRGDPGSTNGAIGEHGPSKRGEAGIGKPL
jgi:hypothetical protein